MSVTALERLKPLPPTPGAAELPLSPPQAEREVAKRTPTVSRLSVFGMAGSIPLRDVRMK